MYGMQVTKAEVKRREDLLTKSGRIEGFDNRLIELVQRLRSGGENPECFLGPELVAVLIA